MSTQSHGAGQATENAFNPMESHTMSEDMEVFTLNVRHINDHIYRVASYQRGYRWTDRQVQDLCDDIYTYGSNGREYCLQQLVVKQLVMNDTNERDGEKKIYEVIDGQQRLTTLSIIMAALDLDDKRPEIRYTTRSSSQNFLNDIKDKEKGENVDEAHMIKAYHVCKKWINKPERKRDEFKAAIENCFFIWYDIGNQEPYDVFKRLNSGKIELTNAELIKSVLLNKDLCRDMTFPDDESKNSFIQHERSIQWDEMMRMFADDKFWHFICPLGKRDEYENKRADYLMYLGLGKEAEAEPQEPYKPFRYVFEQSKGDQGYKKIADLWSDLKRVYSHIVYSFYDKELYHLIGFINSAEGRNLSHHFTNEDLKSDKSDYTTLRKKIKEIIKDYIKSLFNENDKDKQEENFESRLAQLCKELKYTDNKKEISDLLLLFNIVTLQNEKSEDVRYPFHIHKTQKWSLEHIHAKKEDPCEDDFEKYVDELKVSYEKLPGDRKAAVDEKIAKWLAEAAPQEDEKTKEDVFECLKKITENRKKVFELYEFDWFEYEQSMGNLALLPKAFNSRLSNKSFQGKRKDIAKKDDDIIVPICTRNAFFNFYSPEKESNVIWDFTNAERYIETISKTITKYLFARV